MNHRIDVLRLRGKANAAAKPMQLTALLRTITMGLRGARLVFQLKLARVGNGMARRTMTAVVASKPTQSTARTPRICVQVLSS
jgi:hypothetical protein